MNIVAYTAPELDDAARLHMWDRISRIDQRDLAVELLLKSNPEQMHTKNQLSEWIGLPCEHNATIRAPFIGVGLSIRLLPRFPAPGDPAEAQ